LLTSTSGASPPRASRTCAAAVATDVVVGHVHAQGRDVRVSRVQFRQRRLVATGGEYAVSLARQQDGGGAADARRRAGD
jgi:hypothetical protein